MSEEQTIIKLNNENRRLRKELEKSELFKQMLKNLITEHFGITEFNSKQTIYGCLDLGIRQLKEKI